MMATHSRQSFFTLEPEVAAQMGERTALDTAVHPPIVHHLHLQFNGWLGDDLLETFPCFIVSGRLKEKLEQLDFTGCTIDDLEMTTSEVYRDLHPDRTLPRFFWLKICGEAGSDDFGLSDDHCLVVSKRVLDCARSFSLRHCEIQRFGEAREF